MLKQFRLKSRRGLIEAAVVCLYANQNMVGVTEIDLKQGK
jgi:hypothetical protein